jgi:Domain of unknown function (DUF4331)
MSHHFDTPTGREDPRLNLNDFYLFAGAPGTTVMAMTVNPAVDPSSTDLFRDEGLYVFRFDTDRDGREDVSFKVRFGEVVHTDGPTGHAQSVQVRRAEGGQARQGDEGELLADGFTSREITAEGGVRVFAGVTRDLFAGDASALHVFEDAFAQGRYAPEAFENRADFFAPRHVAAIVLEVPNELIGTGGVHAWATVSLHGHAPERQVARWGLPLVTHLWIRDDAMREDFNRTAPSADNERFAKHIAEIITMTVGLAGTAADPMAYAQRVLEKVGDMTLPYEIGSAACFGYAGFNGRGLQDDVMDVMLSLTANASLGDGVAPDPERIAARFPYFAASSDHS